jgi:hypothetical protein
MSNPKKPTKALALVAVQELISGTQKRLPTSQFMMGNAVYTSAQLITLLQSVADAMTKQTAAQKAAKDALTEQRDVTAKAHPIIQGYRDLLITMYGSASQTLADFGLSPRKVRRTLTVQQKATAKAKRDATRAAHKAPSGQATPAPTGTTTAPAATPAPAPPTPPAKPAS